MDKIDNGIEIQIKVPNQTRYLSLIGQISENLVKEICQLPDKNELCANIINVVATEAVVNAIKHANTADPDTFVKIIINVSDKELSINVYDSGQGFELNTISTPDLISGSLDESGRGIFIIKSLMDSVVYKKANGGNVLEMKKKLSC
ncbi:ATP-binding protein [Geobacter sp. SVR]|uniref:ATP-binding protein n=1 Tax=Geobacter sp. SVR TaxID=2495594 RepID=UPI00143F01CE|nr:ATP-binding protein [Geobacter sp. SVR]BCS51878.1 anti-sigma factor [Geobacter sp. SVR]GCF87738.1 anti-sigma factor [Geobacter sp. SVR]